MVEKPIMTIPGKIAQVRWIMHLKNNKKVVENLQHNRGWREQYRKHYGQIELLTVQILPQNIKLSLESPKGLYWTFEDMSVGLAGGLPKHERRSICAKGKNGRWDVITVDLETGIVTQRTMSAKNIGYEEKVKGRS